MNLIAALFIATAFAAAEEVTFPTPHDYLFTPPPNSAGATAFSLSKTLGDHMVLQRDTPSMVWGFAAPGTTVKTTFNSIRYTSTAGSDTIWRQSLPSTPATLTGQTITFSASTGETGQLQDVLFGDVYICSGQSSFYFSMRVMFATRGYSPLIHTNPLLFSQQATCNSHSLRQPMVPRRLLMPTTTLTSAT